MFSTNYKTIIHSKFAEDGSLPDLDNATHQELETVQYERQPCNVTEYVTKLHLVLKLHNKSRDDLSNNHRCITQKIIYNTNRIGYD